MIQKGTKLIIADNTGARTGVCIGILDNSMQETATVGDRIVVAVKNALSNGSVKSGDVSKAVVIRTRKEVRRNYGDYIDFSDNAVVLINDNNDIKGTRVFGPVSRELINKGFNKITSLAEEVL
jgi:large subunit ribosomal protein L14